MRQIVLWVFAGWCVGCGPAVGLDDGGSEVDPRENRDERDAGQTLDASISAPSDAGAEDAGVEDAGAESSDAGAEDAGFSDAGMPDAGVPDAGIADAGTADAGMAEWKWKAW